MFFRLHFVLNLLTFALEKFVKVGTIEWWWPWRALRVLGTGIAAQTCYTTFGAPLPGISSCRRDRFCYCLFPCWIRYSLLRTIFLRKLSRPSYHQRSCFSPEKENQKRSERQKATSKTSFIAFYQLKFYFVSFSWTSWEERRSKWNGTGNSFRREQQQTINKITIDDEAHAAAAAAYMWSILTLSSKNFISLFACFFSTNKYISIELVQWNTLSNERPRQVQQKKQRMRRKKPETIGKGTKMNFHVF